MSFTRHLTRTKISSSVNAPATCFHSPQWEKCDTRYTTLMTLRNATPVGAVGDTALEKNLGHTKFGSQL